MSGLNTVYEWKCRHVFDWENPKDRQSLGAFAQLRKATISFMSVRLSVCLSPFVRPSVCMEELGSHWTVFDQI